MKFILAASVVASVVEAKKKPSLNLRQAKSLQFKDSWAYDRSDGFFDSLLPSQDVEAEWPHVDTSHKVEEEVYGQQNQENLNDSVVQEASREDENHLANRVNGNNFANFPAQAPQDDMDYRPSSYPDEDDFTRPVRVQENYYAPQKRQLDFHAEVLPFIEELLTTMISTIYLHTLQF